MGEAEEAGERGDGVGWRRNGRMIVQCSQNEICKSYSITNMLWLLREVLSVVCLYRENTV